jgi:hypothetical protein
MTRAWAGDASRAPECRSALPACRSRSRCSSTATGRTSPHRPPRLSQAIGRARPRALPIGARWAARRQPNPSTGGAAARLATPHQLCAPVDPAGEGLPGPPSPRASNSAPSVSAAPSPVAPLGPSWRISDEGGWPTSRLDRPRHARSPPPPGRLACQDCCTRADPCTPRSGPPPRRPPTGTELRPRTPDASVEALWTIEARHS